MYRRDQDFGCGVLIVGLLACAAGAALAAVYSVPVGGALFTSRIVLKTWQPRVLGAALISSSMAVVVSAFVTHATPVLNWPDTRPGMLLLLCSLALSPLSLGVGVGVAFNRLMARARGFGPRRSWVTVPAIAGAGLLTGICSDGGRRCRATAEAS